METTIEKEAVEVTDLEQSMQVKWGIKSKLLGLILSTVTVALLLSLVLVFIGAERMIYQYGEAIVQSKSEGNANRLGMWTESIQSYLDEAHNTLITVNFDEETEMNYLKSSVNKNESYPNGIYVGSDTGEYTDPSGWVPEADYVVSERDWFKEGLNHETFSFGAAYYDDFTGDYVVSASSLLPTEDGSKRVAAVDFALTEVSKLFESMDLLSTGSAMLIDTTTNTIIAHTNPEMISTLADEKSSDPIVLAIVENIQSKNLASFTIDDSTEKYIASVDPIQHTDWVLATYIPEAEILGGVIKLRNGIMIFAIVIILILAVIFERTINYIINPIKKMTATIVEITAGNFKVEIEPKGTDEVAIMGVHLKRFIETMRTTISDLAQTSTHLGNLSDQSHIVVEHLGQSTMTQTQSMEQLNTTVEELAESTFVMAENASGLASVVSETNEKGTEAKEQMETTVRVSEKGKTDMVNMTKSMQEIEETVTSLVETVQQAESSNQQINGIVDVISDIANQTNLLALNASIEAARAGESGRGFAVVAEEIRKLAESSSKSAQNIATLIDKIKDQMTQAILKSEESVGSIQGSAKLITQSGETFSTIFETVNEANTLINDMLSKIEYVDEVANSVAAISEEQSAGTEEILATIEELAEQSTQISKESETIDKSASDIQTASEKLEDKISIFKY